MLVEPELQLAAAPASNLMFEIGGLSKMSQKCYSFIIFPFRLHNT
jgi:hypothetical protein